MEGPVSMLNNINYFESQMLSTLYSGTHSVQWVMSKQSAQWKSLRDLEVHPHSAQWQAREECTKAVMNILIYQYRPLFIEYFSLGFFLSG